MKPPFTTDQYRLLGTYSNTEPQWGPKSGKYDLKYSLTLLQPAKICGLGALTRSSVGIGSGLNLTSLSVTQTGLHRKGIPIWQSGVSRLVRKVTTNGWKQSAWEERNLCASTGKDGCLWSNRIPNPVITKLNTSKNLNNKASSNSRNIKSNWARFTKWP